nr:MAG TPA: hypothetical protein [Caudoviricetes sp.]
MQKIALVNALNIYKSYSCPHSFLDVDKMWTKSIFYAIIGTNGNY